MKTVYLPPVLTMVNVKDTCKIAKARNAKARLVHVFETQIGTLKADIRVGCTGYVVDFWEDLTVE